MRIDRSSPTDIHVFSGSRWVMFIDHFSADGDDFYRFTASDSQCRRIIPRYSTYMNATGKSKQWLVGFRTQAISRCLLLVPIGLYKSDDPSCM